MIKLFSYFDVSQALKFAQIMIYTERLLIYILEDSVYLITQGEITYTDHVTGFGYDFLFLNFFM